MTFKLGLTGSIGMGKSTTAAMFAECGCDVWDADAAVHRLYDKGGAAVAPIMRVFPDAVLDGAVSRDALRVIIADSPDALGQIEQIVHPLVAKDRADHVAQTDAAIIVLDIPLLYETGGDQSMDAVAVVHIDAATQKHRVMARGTMTEAQFEAILAKQMPIQDKLAKAEFAIETDTLEHAREQVYAIVETIKNRL